MKITIILLSIAIAAMFIFVAVIASLSYERDKEHTNATKPIEDESVTLPDHSQVYPVVIKGYQCFVTSSDSAIWCDKI